MNKEEKIYMFNEYVLGYDKGNNDRSCLIISKIISGNMYVMGSLYDGSAEIISLMLDNLQQENEKLKQINEEHRKLNGMLRERIDNAITYINYILIFNQNINGRLSETLWGQEILEILKGDNNE